MLNAASPAGRLEGFISKIEDFHKLMNFFKVCVNYLLKEIITMFYVKKEKKRKKHVFLNTSRSINGQNNYAQSIVGHSKADRFWL